MSQDVFRPRRARSKRGEGQRLRDEVVAAASSLLADLGDANQLSIRAVAAAVGVTPPSIYRHFADKQALLVAVLEQRWAELERVLAAAAEGVEDPFQALRRICLAYLHFAEAHPGHYRVLFSAAAPAGVSQERSQHPGGPSFSVLLDAVQRCLDAGAPVPAGRTAWFLVAQIWISGHGLVDLRIGQRFPFPWPPADELLDALLTDLGLARPRPRGTAKTPAASAL
jgi:AcrR family transcriptional regulator